MFSQLTHLIRFIMYTIHIVTASSQAPLEGRMSPERILFGKKMQYINLFILREAHFCTKCITWTQISPDNFFFKSFTVQSGYVVLLDLVLISFFPNSKHRCSKQRYSKLACIFQKFWHIYLDGFCHFCPFEEPNHPNSKLTLWSTECLLRVRIYLIVITQHKIG